MNSETKHGHSEALPGTTTSTSPAVASTEFAVVNPASDGREGGETLAVVSAPKATATEVAVGLYNDAQSAVTAIVMGTITIVLLLVRRLCKWTL